MQVTLVGLGLIGGSLAAALRDAGFATRLVGVDESTLHAAQARQLGLVDEVGPLATAMEGSQLVVVAVPVDAMLTLLPQVLSLAPEAATVTDMGSTKASLCAAVEAHPARRRYVASHPMAGTENSGPTAFVRTLFQGKTAVLCDVERSGSEHVARVEGMYRALQMRLIRMPSGEHDLHAAYVSHLSHVISFVLANTVLEKEQDVDTIFDLAGGGFESTVRLAKSAASMWTPIFSHNKRHVLDALDAYLGHLTAFRASLAAESSDENFKLIENANRIRRALDRLAHRGKPS
jgi:prephenate dehydrogenase